MKEPKNPRVSAKGTEQLHCRVDSGLLEWLRLRAERNYRSVAMELTAILSPIRVEDEADQRLTAEVLGFTAEEHQKDQAAWAKKKAEDKKKKGGA